MLEQTFFTEIQMTRNDDQSKTKPTQWEKLILVMN